MGQGLVVALCNVDGRKRQRLRPEHSRLTAASTSARQPMDPYSRCTQRPSFIRPNTAERMTMSRFASPVTEQSASKYSRSQYSATTPGLADDVDTAAASAAPVDTDLSVDVFCDPEQNINNTTHAHLVRYQRFRGA